MNTKKLLLIFCVVDCFSIVCLLYAFLIKDLIRGTFNYMVLFGVYSILFLVLFFVAVSINKSNNKVETSEQKKNRLKLINLYESQLTDSGKFMTIVLTEAIRKLKEIPNVDINKVENWVVKLEKTYMNFN
jgi:hypothetical protein